MRRCRSESTELLVLSIRKAENVFAADVAAQLAAAQPSALVLLDNSSRAAPPVLTWAQLHPAAAGGTTHEAGTAAGGSAAEQEGARADAGDAGGSRACSGAAAGTREEQGLAEARRDGGAAQGEAGAVGTDVGSADGGCGCGSGDTGSDDGGGGGVPMLVVDHHQTEAFPQGALVRRLRAWAYASHIPGLHCRHRARAAAQPSIFLLPPFAPSCPARRCPRAAAHQWPPRHCSRGR
jgi:hypothetical protein